MGRVAGMQGPAGDAAMLTSARYSELRRGWYKTLANLSDHEDIFASTDYLMKKEFRGIRHGFHTKFLKAHAEAQQRFYEESIRLCEGLHDV